MWKPACTCCYLPWAAQDAIRQHQIEELRAETAAGKAASKGKGQDKQGQGKGKGNATAEEHNEQQQDQPMLMQDDAEVATAKNLLTMGLHPAPLLSELKRYPRPILKNDTPAEDQAAAIAITKMEDALKYAKENMMSSNIIAVYNKELATAKAVQAKSVKSAPKATLIQLQERLKHSDTACANAQERHQAHLMAVDAQITQLTAIREFKVKDFSEAQSAFAARLIEDRKAIADLRAELGSLV